MGTLYVVGLPAGSPDDLTIRARRVLDSTARWAAAHPEHARALLAACGLDEPAAGLVSCHQALATLEAEDVALVVDGARLALDEQARRLVAAALEKGRPVVPVPGPSLPLAALVTSGLPAGGFCYGGELPEAPDERRAAIETVAAERRTLLFVTRGEHTAAALDDLLAALGDRPLVIVPGGAAGGDPPWRGTLSGLAHDAAHLTVRQVLVLVIGGATEEPAAWDEARLDAAIARRVARGDGAKQISQALAEVSGWSRREIYRRATAGTGTRPDR